MMAAYKILQYFHSDRNSVPFPVDLWENGTNKGIVGPLWFEIDSALKTYGEWCLWVLIHDGEDPIYDTGDKSMQLEVYKR